MCMSIYINICSKRYLRPCSGPGPRARPGAGPWGICMYIYVCICTCIYVYVYVYMCISIYTCIIIYPTMYELIRRCSWNKADDVWINPTMWARNNVFHDDVGNSSIIVPPDLLDFSKSGKESRTTQPNDMHNCELNDGWGLHEDSVEPTLV